MRILRLELFHEAIGLTIQNLFIYSKTVRKCMPAKKRLLGIKTDLTVRLHWAT